MSIVTARPSLGAVPNLDTIRVGIFMEIPGKYKLNTTTATFSSAAGLQVGLRQPSGVKSMFQTNAGATIRFTLDDYKPKLLETPDFQTALTVVKRLKALGGSGLLTSLTKANGIVYQVLEGTYSSAAEASAAGDRWLRDGTIAGLSAGKTKADITGPLHLETGTFASQAEAQQSAASLGSAGIDAFPALKQTADGATSFTVLVGAAPDIAALDNVRAQAAKSGNGVTLNQTDPQCVYLPIRSDYTFTESPNSPTSLYSVPMTGAKVWLSTAGAAGIKLMERYNRSYRGQFEVSGLNNKLTVVNEVPFEQYLYSVVGAEMPASWPTEALKSQAVAARTYALYQGFGFQVAHVVDTTLSQAYGGIGSEKPATIVAVDATKGEVAMYNGKVIESVFSSSAGGQTADAKEIWGTDIPYLKSVQSPDQSSELGLYHWQRVVLPTGEVGYIREDLLEDTGQKSPVGKPLMRVKGDGVKVRPIPLIQDNVEPVALANRGTIVVSLETVVQSNEMSWVRGPFTPGALLSLMQGKLQSPVTAPIQTLEVSQSGTSGRPTELQVNGQRLNIKYPDLFRSILGGLPSTRFNIDEMARMTIAGSGGRISSRPDTGGALAVTGGEGQTTELNKGSLFIMDGQGNMRAATTDTAFRFVGSGYGHGVGLSQYGARGLAEQGYDYKYILQYYYKDVTIVKE
ncbi:SpoIID/LytB domain-containing protein [Paenibacillus sp. sptzw28]|uniref:SpoIID/LytB domain-containing protein n=1 Tax=Paenibacillus sp. sptzw28 TaxID=715179 RepID=UPI002163E4D4|nr:SpoIID/LytB domain-containing protein [Paenibacillus sp. sptzw28]